MGPAIITRAVDGEGEEKANNRTRVDDTDPSIAFSPSSSPYLDQQSPWVIVNDPLAYKGSAVMTNRTDARLTFNFPGDSLAIALLYKAAGTKVDLTLENGTSIPFEVTPSEAAATAPNGNKEALQKKIFHLTGLPCKNHTATLAPARVSDATKSQSVLYFDWFSFPTVDTSAACVPSTLSPSDSAASRTRSSLDSSSLPTSHDHTMEYAGIGAGAAVFGFIFALLVFLIYRRKKRRPVAVVDKPDRSYRPRRTYTSDEMVSTQLIMSQRSSKSLLEPESVFRPRGIHALAHNESFGSANTGSRHSVIDSPSTNAVFPLLPMSPAENMARMDDGCYSIGYKPLDLKHDPNRSPRETRHSPSKLPYEKARAMTAIPQSCSFPSRQTLVLSGGAPLQRMPYDQVVLNVAQTMPGGASNASVAYQSPRRPCTASAVERLRTEARQLDVHRPLSPFDRNRPTTSAEMLQRTGFAHPATDSAASQRFRRNSSCSVDTHWSYPSADAHLQALENLTEQLGLKGNLSSSKSGAVESIKTTDSETEMWVTKRSAAEFRAGMGRKRSETSRQPRRPPKSPYRPSTGEAAPPPLSNHPFTLS